MAVPDLADRVQSIIDDLSVREGKRVSARELARRAEITESHVGLILKRRVTRPSHDIIEAIAKAGSVDSTWLSSGAGPKRRETIVLREDRYAAMPAVRAMARASGFDDAFVKTWEVHLDADDQPDADYLWTLCKADYARWKRKAPAARGNPLADLDEPPVRPARKNR